MSSLRPSRRDDFEVAIICALPLEYDAVSYIFDEFWDGDGDQYRRGAGGPNSYTTGRVGNYNVVLALLRHMGKINAASAAASMRSSYGDLRLALLVGVCCGMPRSRDGAVLLGDVVIGKSIIQYDFGWQYPDKFVHKNTVEDNLGRPNKDIRSLLAIFKTDRGLTSTSWNNGLPIFFSSSTPTSPRQGIGASTITPLRSFLKSNQRTVDLPGIRGSSSPSVALRQLKG